MCAKFKYSWLLLKLEAFKLLDLVLISQSGNFFGFEVIIWI